MSDITVKLSEEEALWLEQAARFGAKDTIVPGAAEQLDALSAKLNQAVFDHRRSVKAAS